jgi:hypothetical protein
VININDNLRNSSCFGVDGLKLNYDDILLGMQSSVGVSYVVLIVFLEERMSVTSTCGWDLLCGCAEASWNSEMTAREKVAIFILNF